ncbi:hypothetical protein ACFFRR_005837 [Megaselia abdita]
MDIRSEGQEETCFPDFCCEHGLDCSRENFSCVCPGTTEITNVLTCNGQKAIFITASQIALSIALLMGLAALLMVMYRLCTKPRYLRRQHLAEREYRQLDRSYACYLRASLTSIQIRVLTRLRDRPPRYDNRILAAQQSCPPPSYDSINVNVHQPPPYTEIILSPAGFINEGFEEEFSTATQTNGTSPDSNGLENTIISLQINENKSSESNDK